MELPRDRDGAPIHVDDTLYLEGGGEATVTRIEIIQGEHGIDFSVCGNFFALRPEDFTHVRPDSFKRIVDELDAWVDRPASYKEHKEFHTFAERIRKLAAKEGE